MCVLMLKLLAKLLCLCICLAQCPEAGKNYFSECGTKANKTCNNTYAVGLRKTNCCFSTNY